MNNPAHINHNPAAAAPISPIFSMLLFASRSKLVVLTPTECTQTTEQDAEDDPHQPIVTLDKLEDAKSEKNHPN
jgi:hypothetical protein